MPNSEAKGYFRLLPRGDAARTTLVCFADDAIAYRSPTTLRANRIFFNVKYHDKLSVEGTFCVT